MTRLVIHAGTHATDWRTAQRQLVSWRRQLGEFGVILHPADDADTWSADLRDLAKGVTSPHVLAAASAASRQQAEIVLLSSQQLEDSLRSPDNVANLTRVAGELGLPLTVVSVVRDQLGYLNEQYCDRVLGLKAAREFTFFAQHPAQPERLDYATAFDPLLAATDVDFVAVPYSSLRDGIQAHALLAAVGLEDLDLSRLPAAGERRTTPGPVLVAALRLLFKRMWRLGMFNRFPRERLLSCVGEVRDRSSQQGWDISTFWGWAPAARAKAITSFRAGNDSFASRVWGRPWPDEWESGDYVEVDLAATPPLLVDVMTTIDTLIKALQAADVTERDEPAPSEQEPGDAPSAAPDDGV